MASFNWPPQSSSGSSGVTSVNGLSGDLTLVAGTGITITPSGTNITITASAFTAGNLTDTGTDGIIVTGGTGAVIGSGTSLAQHVADTTHNGYLSSTDWNTFNGKQASGSYITSLSGDGTASGPGAAAFTLTSVNANIGSFGSSTSIPSFTVNAKGLLTAAGSNVVIAPAGTLSGTTLNSTVVSSSLTSVGTIITGVWDGTTIALANGGTGQTSAANAFIALAPLTTAGDLLYENASPAPARLAIGSTGNVLTVSGGLPTWAPPATSGTVTSVGLSLPSIITVSGSPVTGSGTLTGTLATQAANLVFSGPSSGSVTTPTFRSLVANDIPSTLNSTNITGTVAGSGAGSGVVGQVLISDVTTPTNTGASGTFFDATSISIPAGSWRLEGNLMYSSTATTWTTVDLRVGISTTSGNSGTGLVNGTTQSQFNGAANINFNAISVMTPVVFINISTQTTYYLKGTCDTFTGSPQYVCRFTAQRIF